MPAGEVIICVECGEPFKRPYQKGRPPTLCSNTCKNKRGKRVRDSNRKAAREARTCLNCGVDISDRYPNAKYCSRQCWEKGPVAQKLRRANLWARYGLTEEEYVDLAKAHRTGCAICGAAPPPGEKLVVDHDHDDDSIRGMLCTRCNVGLGMFQDDPERLQLAAQYLRTHRSVVAWARKKQGYS